MGDAGPMASGHDAHDDHGHDDHGHGEPEGDTWVLVPLVIGLVIGIIVVAVVGLGADVAPFT